MAVDETTRTTAVAEPEAPEEVEHHVEPSAGGAGHDIHLPPESLWPITLAFAITIIFFGFVTNWLVSIPGFFLFAVALRGWVEELFHAKH